MKNHLLRSGLVVTAAMLALTGCSNSDSGNADGGKTYADYAASKKPGEDQFDFPGNYSSPELTMDGVGDDEQWQGAEVLATFGHDDGVTVKEYRGESALFFLFEVTDDILLTEGETNDDAVTRSDSIEFYLDTKADGGTKPQNDDYQINLGIHGKTRIMQGSGGGWGGWNGLIDYAVGLNGTLNDSGDANDTGYIIEVMIPYSQINIEKDDTIAVSFGHVDKDGLGNQSSTDWAWYGWTYDDFFSEPQTPNNYIFLDKDGNLTKRDGIESPEAPVEQQGVAVTEAFGMKSALFANSTLVLERGEEGINFSFSGTRLLSGHIELYIDTKECADRRENDATCWRIDLNDDGTIGGTHFAGGALVTDGLVYNLTKNDDTGYEATLFIPYSYLDIAADEVFGISLGQWSTTANDWDGWGHQGMFVAPETPVGYVRVSADNKFYRDTKNIAEDNSDAPVVDEPVDYTGYTETDPFGTKADTFADSVLRLKRTDEGIEFDFTGSRRLNGQIELYIDTKECADVRESDATCWRIDLMETGLIGGTHFAGGALVTDGLEYNLINNSESGYRATLFIPYSYLGITADEVFGISLGQWSTTANDWDGWTFEGAFVAPETPATYVRVGADGELYTANNNNAQ